MPARRRRRRRYALHVPASLPMDATAPLLCAGITTYSPLRYYGLVSNAAAAAVGRGGEPALFLFPHELLCLIAHLR